MQLGIGMGLFDTTIRFDGDRDVDVEMSSVSVSGAWLINERWSARAAVGVLLDGNLQPAHGIVFDVEPGGLMALGGEYRALVGDGGVPYVDLSLSLSTSWAKTVAPNSTKKTDYSATDARFGVRTGWNVRDNIFPFVAVRVFGGPVKWEIDDEEVDGSDIYHYQVALGLAAQFGPVGIFAEWAGLGEKAIVLGLSTAW